MAPSGTSTLLRQLGEELVALTNWEFTFLRTQAALQRPRADGVDVVRLVAATPQPRRVSVSFYFGRRFDVIRTLERKHGGSAALYHIEQFSPNARAMRGLEYAGPHTWEVEVECPPPDLASQILGAIRAVAEPCFARFSDLPSARDAIAGRDSWCFGGRAFWEGLLKIDAALGDFDHFRAWSSCLSAFEASRALAMLNAWDESGAVSRG